MKRIIGSGLAALALATAGPALALNLCVEGAYPPFSQTSADGTVVGFDPDIAHALCEEIGETCELVQVRWARMIPALLDGRCDAIVASLSDTAERRKLIDSIPRALAETAKVCSSVNLATTKAGINMDAVAHMGEQEFQHNKL